MYNQRFTTECPECDFKMIVPQTVYNYKFNGEELEQVEVRSIYTVSFPFLSLPPLSNPD